MLDEDVRSRLQFTVQTDNDIACGSSANTLHLTHQRFFRPETLDPRLVSKILIWHPDGDRNEDNVGPVGFSFDKSRNMSFSNRIGNEGQLVA